MGSPEMTSVSVSFEVRRQLNSMRAMENYRSVDELLLHLLKQHRLQNLQGARDKLADRLEKQGDMDVDALVKRLQLSPFRA